MTKFLVTIFGKEGCEKCKVLKARIEHILSQPEWKEFDYVYVDVSTDEGYKIFKDTYYLEKDRIPALAIRKFDLAQDSYVLINDSREPDEILKTSKVEGLMAIQTDYFGEGRGIISPKMIVRLLEKARD